MLEREPFNYDAQGIQKWVGRYNRVEGRQSVFRIVKDGDRHVIRALIENSSERVICQAEPSEAVEKLIEVINIVKKRYNYQTGGAFLINEFGQVLVPTDMYMTFYIGQTTGTLLLRNFDTHEIVDISDDTKLTCGDPWRLPYVGMAYNLSIADRIYHRNKGGVIFIEPHLTDEDLIRKIRSVRQRQAVRILVNPYGIVLTKIYAGASSYDEGQWDSIYVGRINYNKWFKKEDV